MADDESEKKPSFVEMHGKRPIRFGRITPVLSNPKSSADRIVSYIKYIRNLENTTDPLKK